MKKFMMMAGLISILSAAALAQDFGDYSSATLTAKAWEANGAGKLDLALTYIGKCVEMYEAEAVKQQASLTDFAPKEKAHDYWALNDVGTCLYIKAQILEKQGKKDEMLATLRKLTQFKFSQCWDTKGWFWHPAEAAADRLKQLEFDASLDR